MAQLSFEPAFQRLLKSEGGYVNHPDDPGGATNMGVTQRIYNSWRGQNDLPRQGVDKLTEGEARNIFSDVFWNPIGADNLPVGLDYALADFAYHSGPPQALRTFQRTLGVEPTGKWNDATQQALGNAQANLPETIGQLTANRRAFLEALPTWATFGNGWNNRLNDVNATAANAAGYGSWDWNQTLAATPWPAGYGALDVTAGGYGQVDPNQANGVGFRSLYGPTDLNHMIGPQDFASRFNPGTYLQSNPDVAQAGADPWQHFLQSGLTEHRGGSGLSDTDFSSLENLGFYLGAKGGLSPNTAWNGLNFTVGGPTTNLGMGAGAGWGSDALPGVSGFMPGGGSAGVLPTPSFPGSAFEQIGSMNGRPITSINTQPGSPSNPIYNMPVFGPAPVNTYQPSFGFGSPFGAGAGIGS
jgi:lysozyme family protein